MSDGDLDRLRAEQDDVDRDDARTLITLLLLSLGIILATTGAQILRWLL